MTIKSISPDPFGPPKKEPKKDLKTAQGSVDISQHLKPFQDWETPSSKKQKKYEALPIYTSSLPSNENLNLTVRQKKQIKQVQLALEAASLHAESHSSLKAEVSVPSPIEEIPAIREEKGINEKKDTPISEIPPLTAKQRKQLQKAQLAQEAASLREGFSSTSTDLRAAQDNSELAGEWQLVTRKKEPGLKIDPLETPLSNLIEALELSTERGTLYEALAYATQNKERWELENQNQETTLRSGITVTYNKELNSITVTIDGNSIDLASLSMSNPPDSGLSDEEFHQDHLFIIKNQVVLVQKAQEKRARALQNKKTPIDIYYSTKDRISTTNPNLRLKRALMFTANNRVIMHLNKRALKKHLGSGGFKRLSLAIELTTGKRFASASMPLLKESQIKAFSKEVKFGERFKGRPHFVQMYDVVKYKSSKRNTPKARILYECLEGNDLVDILTLPKDKQPTQEERLSILKQLVTIICDLHRESIALKDLKLDNIFLTRDEYGAVNIVMIDFGLLQNIEEENDKMSGSLVYLAPEYRRHITSLHQTIPPQYQLGEFDRRQGDVWALGLLFCLLLEPKDLWQKEIYEALIEHQTSIEGEFTPISRPPLDNTLNSLIYSMLHPDPKQRVTMETVDEFFNPQRHNHQI